MPENRCQVIYYQEEIDQKRGSRRSVNATLRRLLANGYLLTTISEQRTWQD